jgi:hypothetical protein
MAPIIASSPSGYGTLCPKTELCFLICESGFDLPAGDGTMFPEMELCVLFCESESDLPAGNGTLFLETELYFLFCEFPTISHTALPPPLLQPPL